MGVESFRAEISELHEYLTAWLTGREPRGSGKPERLERALADDFMVIHPNGHIGNKTDSVKGFAAAWNEKPNSYAIRVEDLQLRLIGSEYCLATYKEWHEGEPGRGRISTAMLQILASNGMVKWLFLQETPAQHIEPAGIAPGIGNLPPEPERQSR